MTRRPVWTLDEWTLFADRFRRLDDRIVAFAEDFPETLGFGIKHKAALRQSHHAMMSAAGIARLVMEKQHGGKAAEELVARLAGDAPPEKATDRAEASLTFALKSRGDSAPILSRERWAELGRESKAIQEEASELTRILQGTRGATKPLVERFARVFDEICRAKWKLEGLVNCQHPTWGQASQCFSGPNDPKL